MSAKAQVQGAPLKEGAMPDRGPPVQDVLLPRDLQEKKDKEMVNAVFRWYENPGGTVDFCYRRYKDEAIINGPYTDQHKYNVPFGLVRHVNEDCAYPEHSFLMDVNGNPIPTQRKGYQRMEFIPSW